MKIFFPNGSSEWPPTNGPSIHRYQLVKNWSEMGHDVWTLAPDKNPLSAVHKKNVAEVLRLTRAASCIYCRAEFISAATELTSPLKRLVIPKRTPVVWEINVQLDLRVAFDREMSAQDFENKVRRLRKCAQRVDAAIAVCQTIGDQARDLLGIDPVVVVQNGSDPEMFRPDAEAPAALPPTENLRAVWIGSHANKIHDAGLVESLGHHIDQQQLPIELHVIGNTRELFDSRLPSSVVYHGPVSYLELPKYLAAMDVGLTLYRIQYDGGSPLKLFDYLASGCIPICSQSSSMSEVLDGQHCGYIDNWTTESLAGRLMQLHQEPELRQRLARSGRDLIVDTYNWQKIAAKILDVIAEAKQRRGFDSAAVSLAAENSNVPEQHRA